MTAPTDQKQSIIDRAHAMMSPGAVIDDDDLEIVACAIAASAEALCARLDRIALALERRGTTPSLHEAVELAAVAACRNVLRDDPTPELTPDDLARVRRGEPL